MNINLQLLNDYVFGVIQDDGQTYYPKINELTEKYKSELTEYQIDLCNALKTVIREKLTTKKLTN